MTIKGKIQKCFCLDSTDRQALYKFIFSCGAVAVLYGILLYFMSSSNSFTVGLISGILLFVATPMLAMLFGFYSYAITKRVLLPNFLLFLTYDLWIGGLIAYLVARLRNIEIYSFSSLFDAIPIACIVTGISLATSLVARSEYRSFMKKGGKYDTFTKT